MGKTDKSDSPSPFALILRPPDGQHLPALFTGAPEASSHSHFFEWFEALKTYLPDESDPELTEYFEFALMGLTVGFVDRDLSPFLPAHTALIPVVLGDIRQVYRQVMEAGTDYSPEEFIFRAYDYGIHKAYYLDWDLYMSHEMY